MKPVFAIQDIPTGRLNALVKTLMRQMRVNDPVEVVRRINSREWTATKAVSFVSEKDSCSTSHCRKIGLAAKDRLRNSWP